MSVTRLVARRAFLSGLAGVAALAQQRKLNLLVVTADNLGYGDLGCYGNTEILTPELDRFASQGARLTNFYCSSPTCTASRAGLLTGRHPARYGLNYQLGTEENRTGVGIPHSEKLLPEYVKPQDYATGCFGKWNVGFAPGSRPTERGFDRFLGHRSGNIDYYTHRYNDEEDLYEGVEPIEADGYATDLFADAAIEFMTRRREHPFLTYLPFNSPHFPNPKNKRPGESNEWQAPDRTFARYGYSPSETDERKRYRVVVTALDEAFGRVMRALDETGLAERTLVWFYSDNGAFMLPGRGLEVQTNAPLRSGGVTCWEGGIRVAGMVRLPGVIPAGRDCDALLSAHDVLPLAVRLAGGAMPSDRIFDGVDPLPALKGEAAPERDALYFEWEDQQAVRSGRWKAIRQTPGSDWELYDLERDVGETTDAAASNPDVARGLGAKFEAWRGSAS